VERLRAASYKPGCYRVMEVSDYGLLVFIFYLFDHVLDIKGCDRCCDNPGCILVVRILLFYPTDPLPHREIYPHRCPHNSGKTNLQKEYIFAIKSWGLSGILSARAKRKAQSLATASHHFCACG